VCCLSFFDFVSIVELLNAIYCLAELLEFAAFIALRVTAPNLPRPYRCARRHGRAAPAPARLVP
jgi:hypothetical protein